MNDPESYTHNEPVPRPHVVGDSHSRAVGSPLPIGGGGRPPLEEGVQSLRQGALSGHAPSTTAAQQLTSLDHAINAVRLAIPFVQKIVPLLEGNFGATISNILTPHPPQQQNPPVDLEPIENGLTDLRTQHRELRNQVAEQNSSLKRVEDQLEMVREATDRNTLEQQELVEDLKSVGNKVNVVAVLALALLAVSIALNVVLYLHILRVLP